MKTRSAILAGLALLSLASCNKNDLPGDNPPGEHVVMTVSVGDPLTKSTSASRDKENSIGSAQVLVFDSAGATEAYASGTSGSFTLGVAAGAKTVWAVVNCADDLSGIRNASELSGKAVDLRANGVSSLVMAGSRSANVSSSSNSVTVVVSHLVAKVVVDRITRNFSVSSTASLPLKIRGVYLVNVVGNSNLAGNASASTWYNKLGHKDTGLDALLYDSVGSTLANGASYSTVHTFYPFPNASTSTSTSSTWSARKTMLVIDTELDGKDNYYPIFINALERNKIYEFTSITLTKRGSPDPYTPVTSEDVSFTVKVSDFVPGATYTETI